MVDPSTSTSLGSCVEFNDEFMNSKRHLPVHRLQEELALLEKDNHPLLLQVLRNIKMKREVENDRLVFHHNLAEYKAEKNYDAKRREYKKELDSRVIEMQEEAVRKAEAFVNSVDTEYGGVDINKPHIIPVIYETNKKTLRGRGGGQIIEVPTYLNANQSIRLPEITYDCTFDDSRIRSEIDSVSNNTIDTRRRHILNVSFQKPKLTVDNKSYKQGEDVYVYNRQFGEVHARIEQISDKHVIFKGVQGWDTRQIIASLEDLEDNRVSISKSRGKDAPKP